jgi:hypothetical protein
MPDLEITSPWQICSRPQPTIRDSTMQILVVSRIVVINGGVVGNNRAIAPIKKAITIREVGSWTGSQRTRVLMNIFKRNQGSRQLGNVRMAAGIREVLVKRLLTAFEECQTLQQRRRGPK